MIAQFLKAFVQCETWRIGCDLKEHTARFAEVNRVKVSPVDHRRYVVTEIDQTFVPHELLGVIANAKRHMMHRTGRYAPGRTIGLAQQIDNPSSSCFAQRREPKTITRLLHRPVTEGLGQ